MYMALWKQIEKQLNVSLENLVKNYVYINPKLATQEGKFEMTFYGAFIPFNYGVKATTILKIGNVLRATSKVLSAGVLLRIVKS